MASYRQGDEPVPGYRLESFLGRGGFGEVWKADGPGGTPAAMKFISLSGKQGLKEFRALGLVKRIRHPNLVPITAFWLKDRDGRVLETEIGDSLTQLPAKAQPGQPAELIIAMGLGDCNLLDRLEQCREEHRQGIPPEELLDYLEDAARAIDYMNSPVHDLGNGPMAVQHCDIKPQNIMIVGGAAQVCDFGLARALDDVRVTTAAGSPAYGAPEVLEGNKPSASTDQYSLAISYVELRTGELPFADQSLMGVINAHLQGQLDLSRLSPPEREVILKATSRRPEDRFPNTQKMIRALRRAVEGSSPSAGAPAAPSPATAWPLRSALDLEVGAELVPGYRLTKHVVRGGTNDVWEATAPGGKSVAMLVRRLEPGRETVDLAALGTIQQLDEHPHLTDMQAYWLLDDGGNPIDPGGSRALERGRWLIIAGKLAKGTLLDRLDESRRQSGWGIPAPELLAYMDQIAKAVDFLNAPRHVYRGRSVGLVHGNLRPVNFLLVGDVVRLGNFGRATLLEGEIAKLSQAVGYEHPYTPPETMLGRVTRWSDQYGLAIAYVQLRTGRLPFPATASTTELVDLQKAGRLDLSALTPAEEKVVQRAVDLEPKKRFENCEAFVAALRGAVGVAAPAMTTADKPGGTILTTSGGVATAVATATQTAFDPLRATMPTTTAETPTDSGLLPEMVRHSRDAAATTATMLLGGEAIQQAPEAPAAELDARGTLYAPGASAPSKPAGPASRDAAWHRPKKKSRRGWYALGGSAVLVGALAVVFGLRQPNETPIIPPSPTPTPTPTPTDTGGGGAVIPPPEPASKTLLATIAEQRNDLDTGTFGRLEQLQQAHHQAKELGDASVEAVAALGCQQALARLDRWSEAASYPVVPAKLADPVDRQIAESLALLSTPEAQLDPVANAGPLGQLETLWPQREKLPTWERDHIEGFSQRLVERARTSLVENSRLPPAEGVALAVRLLKLSPNDSGLLSGKAFHEVRAKQWSAALATYEAAGAANPQARESLAPQRLGLEALLSLDNDPAEAAKLVEESAKQLPATPIAVELLARVDAARKKHPALQGAALRLFRSANQGNLLDPAGKRSLGEMLGAELNEGLRRAVEPSQIASLGPLANELGALDSRDPLPKLIALEARLDGATPLTLADRRAALAELREIEPAESIAPYVHYLTARVEAIDPSQTGAAAQELIAASSGASLPEWLGTEWRRRWSYDLLVNEALAGFELPDSFWLPGILESPFRGTSPDEAMKCLATARQWLPPGQTSNRRATLCEAFAAYYSQPPQADVLRTTTDELLKDEQASPALRDSLLLLQAEASRLKGDPVPETLKQFAGLSSRLTRRIRECPEADAVATYDKFVKPTLTWADQQNLDDPSAKASLAVVYGLEGSLFYRFANQTWGDRVSDPKEAELAAYNRAVELAPQNAQYLAYRGMANVRRATPDFDEAEKDAAKAIEVNPKHPAGHGLLGLVRLERSRREPDVMRRYDLARSSIAPIDEAIAACRGTQDADSDYSDRLELYLINGSVARVDTANRAPAGTMDRTQQGDMLAEAATLAEEAANRNETYRYLAYATLGNAREDMAWIALLSENYDAAIQAFSNQIDFDPHPEDGYFNRGRCYLKRVRDGLQDRKYLDNAVADLTQARDSAPEMAEADFWLGWSLAERDGWPKALEAFRAAVAKANKPGEKELFAFDLAHAAYETGLHNNQMALATTGAAKQRVSADAKKLFAECREAATLAGAPGRAYVALSYLAENDLAKAGAALATDAAKAESADADLLGLLATARYRRISRELQKLPLEAKEVATIIPLIDKAFAKGDRRMQVLASYELARTLADFTKSAGADAVGERGSAMQTILMALDQDSGRAEASVLRAQLLKFMYSLLFTSQGQAALGKAKAQKYLTAEACETARKVYSDPVAVAADREYARGLLAGALKDSASKLTDRPFLGISPYLVEPGAKTITSACKVASVALGSPAALAGIVRGDLIVRFNDKPIASLDDFDAALAAEKAGNSVTIVVRRGMDEHPIPIVLGEPR